MRLLVTGASGLVGRALVGIAAADAGSEVVVCGRRAPLGLPPNVAFVGADLTDPAAAAALVEDVAPSHIVHAAWETRQPTYWNDPVNLDWAIATTRMAQAFVARGGLRFVQVGSCAEYDWSVVEDGRLSIDRPATRYGKAKLAAFRGIEAAAHDLFEAVEARIFWVYGAGENPDRFIPLICRAHAAGTTPALGSGRQERDLLHVDDAAAALLALCAVGGPTGVVDIGGGVGTPLATAASLIADLAGARDAGLAAHADRADDPPRLIADARALRATGWTPRVTLRDGLARTFAWWREREALSA